MKPQPAPQSARRVVRQRRRSPQPASLSPSDRLVRRQPLQKRPVRLPLQTGRSTKPQPCLLFHFVWRHPLILVVLTWVGLVATAGVATIELVRLKPEPTVAVVQSPSASLTPTPPALIAPSPAPPQTVALSSSPAPIAAEPLPIWSLGAIALSCVSGCLMLSSWLRPRPPVKQLQPEGHRAKATKTTRPAADRSTAGLAATVVPERMPAVLEPTATLPIVVPEGRSLPLDWDEPSLADSLDVRQSKSVSHWLSL